MLRWRTARHVAAGLAVFVMAGGASNETQAADYEFQADYRISLNGLPIGRANLQASFEGAEYRIDGSARLTGVAGLLFDFTSTAAAAGRIGANRPQPTAFSADSTNGRVTKSVRMTLQRNAVRQLQLDPPVPPEETSHPEHVPITDAHRRDIVDPVTAMIGFGGYDGQNFDRSICQRAVPIFNGRERFDVRLEFAGERDLSSNSANGYSGPAIVCKARYRAIAGHRADMEEVEQLEDKMVFEVVLAPLVNSDLVVPYQVSVSTPLGVASISVSNLKAEGAMTTQSAAASR